MTGVERERLVELAALGAAGAATDDERRELDGARARDPGVAALYDDMAAAAALLGEALPPIAPPPGVLASVRARIARDSGASDVATAPGAGARARDRRDGPEASAGRAAPTGEAAVVSLAERRRKRQAVAVAVAGLSLAAAAAMTMLWARAQGAADELRRELSVARAEGERTRQELARAEREGAGLEARLVAARERAGFVQTPSLRLATLSQNQATVKILIDPDQRRWLVYAYQMPGIATDRDYQLWFLPIEGAPVPSQVLRRGDGGAFEAEVTMPPDLDLSEIKGAAISVEPAGGSPTGVPTEVAMGGLI